MAILAYPPETPTASIRRAVVTPSAAAQAVLPARPHSKTHWRVRARWKPIRRAWSPPVIAFRVFQFGGWFLAGMVTALKAGSNRIAHALGAAVLGTLVFMNPLHSLLCMLLSALGAGAVAAREDGRAG